MIFRKFSFRLLMLSVAGLLVLAGVYTGVAAEPLAPQANTDIVINEVFYGGDGTQDWIELKNTGSDTIDISSWVFCARLNYSNQTLAGLTLLDGNDLVLSPGEIVTLRWMDLNNSASDLGLYTSSANFADPNLMVDYLQWGTATNTGRANVAMAKGIWRETAPSQFDFVPSAGSGQSTAYSGTNSGSGLLTFGTDFTNGPPTRGQENTATASLTVSKRSQSATVSAGGLITYTLTVTSSGTTSNTNVVLTDTVPLSTTFVSAGVSPVGGVLTWTLGQMAPMSETERTFTVAAADSSGTGVIPLPGGTIVVNDDYGVSSDQASASGPPVMVTVQMAGLSVSKRAQPATVSPGGLITYTLTVTSSGTLSNTNVVLTDTVPLSTTFVSAAVSPVGGVLTWTLGQMAPMSATERTFIVAAADSGGTGLIPLPSGTLVVNDDYGVSSDQASGGGPPVTVTVFEGNNFIFLPIVFK